MEGECQGTLFPCYVEANPEWVSRGRKLRKLREDTLELGLREAAELWGVIPPSHLSDMEWGLVDNTQWNIPDRYSGVRFSDCRRYRYALWRRWGRTEQKNLVVIGLNPSTADQIQDDPTIRRCIRFAKDWHCGGLVMLNAFGFRSTDPKGMAAVADPVGFDNDSVITEYAKSADMVLAAWGVHCPDERERELLGVIGRDVHCLGRTNGNKPRHPLYVRADVKPELYWSQA
jgi:hypothetical protein